MPLMTLVSYVTVVTSDCRRRERRDTGKREALRCSSSEKGLYCHDECCHSNPTSGAR